uniref:NADH:quinone oxidoreductase/Mrp antiporter transmembrane domain-containing protein n=1 Tax=Candidatus Methanomethylicus mesodigestus TaxID=1867258 RepID=A0A7C3IX94_9CREN
MTETVTNLWSIPLLLIIPILTAIVVNFLYGKVKAIRVVAILSSLALFAIAVISPYGYHWFTGQPAVLLNGGYTYSVQIFAWRLSLELYFGYMQQIMIAVMSLLLIFVVAISTKVMSKNMGTYIGLIFLIYMSSAAIIMVNDFYHLWIAVEIGSLLVAGLVAASGESISQKAALKYTFFSAISGAGLAIALALILGITGYPNVSDAIVSMHINNIQGMQGILYVAFGFLVLSWIYAGGLAPIHPLKSDVYGASFPHATVMLQTQSKLMLVAIGLIILRVFGTLPFAKEVMLGISVITMMVGVVMALLQTDFRWTLAYLIISHSGLVTVGISLGTISGIIGGMFQAINDVLYMSILLLCCEAIYYYGKGTSIKSVSGMAKKAPWLAFAAVVGAFAASGIPPFNGFQSEIILIQASLASGLPEVAVVILMVSVTTFIALFKSIYCIFLKADSTPETEQAQSRQGSIPVPKVLYLSLGVLIVLVVLIGVYPQLATDFLNDAAIKVVSMPWVP